MALKKFKWPQKMLKEAKHGLQSWRPGDNTAFDIYKIISRLEFGGTKNNRNRLSVKNCQKEITFIHIFVKNLTGF